MSNAHEPKEASPIDCGNYSIYIHLDKCVIIDLGRQLLRQSTFDDYDNQYYYFCCYNYFGYKHLP